MIILNFSHPITPMQRQEIEALTGKPISEIYDIRVYFDNERSFRDQILGLADAMPVDSMTLQTEPVIINPPSASSISASLIAWLHGQMGYFPTILRISQEKDSLPPVYHVAEIINLQSLRDAGRAGR